MKSSSGAEGSPTEFVRVVRNPLEESPEVGNGNNFTFGREIGGNASKEPPGVLPSLPSSKTLSTDERVALYSNLTAEGRNKSVVELAQAVLAGRAEDRRTEVRFFKVPRLFSSRVAISTVRALP